MRAFLEGRRPLGFAHRGGAALWPENTMLAFEGALDLGIRYLEMDLHLTRDGVIVVHHDATLDRTTDATGLVRTRTLAELKRIDAGFRFRDASGATPYRGKGLSIPTLAEVFELSPDVRVNVEIKQRGPELPIALARFIQARGLEDRVLVAAAHHPLIADFRRCSQGTVATSASAKEALAFWAAVRSGRASRRTWEFDALQVPVTQRLGPLLPELVVVDERFVEAAHAGSIHVHPWVVDSPNEMRRLCAMGVDGVMTDRPDYWVRIAASEPARDRT